MRPSIGVLAGALLAPAILFSFAGRSLAQEPSGHISIDNAAELEIEQSGDTEPSDSFQLDVTFTNNDLSAEGSCDGDDPVSQGLTVTLGTGSCGNSSGVVSVAIPPFSSNQQDQVASAKRKHHKNRKRHFKQKGPVTATDPSNGETENATLQAKITVLPTPAGTCGQWNLEAEVSQVDLSALTANPVVVSITQGDDSGCNDQIQAQFDNEDNQGDDNDQGGDDNNQNDE